ncbi:MAG TPA: sodium-dependent transporter, partial [Euryarchaeota archaeon]|nr:sodium-dependent transporter [Euryarchaeota archaeon]
METVEKRGGFSGKLGFILATAGAAVGLGNLWRFPYLAEQYGGGIFLLVYLILVVTFGVVMLITELAIGRRTGKSSFDALMDLCDKYPIIGWVSMLVPMIIVPYYCVIGGWVTKYFADYAVGAGSDLAGSGFFDSFISMDIGGVFDNPLPWFLIYAFLTIIVVVFGVEKGIERMSKILMPALFILLIAICVYMMTIDGISEGLKYYLVPDFDQLSFSTVAGAASQLFYSLSIAMGITIAYGSYMRKQDNIEKRRPNPLLISVLLENRTKAGTIISPDRKATQVSVRATVYADFSMLS